jgi:hypothetical protein
MPSVLFSNIVTPASSRGCNGDKGTLPCLSATICGETGVGDDVSKQYTLGQKLRFPQGKKAQFVTVMGIRKIGDVESHWTEKI